MLELCLNYYGSDEMGKMRTAFFLLFEWAPASSIEWL